MSPKLKLYLKKKFYRIIHYTTSKYTKGVMKTLPQIICPHLIRVLDYGEHLQSSFYVWDPSLRRVTPKVGKSVVFVQFGMILSLSVIIGQVASLLWTRDATTLERFQGSVLCFAYISGFILRWEWTPNHDCVVLMNLICHGIQQKSKLSKY